MQEKISLYVVRASCSLVQLGEDAPTTKNKLAPAGMLPNAQCPKPNPQNIKY